MLKQTIALLVFSIAIIFTMGYAQHGLQLLVTGHDWVSQSLTEIFSGGGTGNTIRLLLALLAIPAAMGIVSVMLYWLIKRAWFPFFMHVVWATWLLQVAALAIMYKG